MEPEDPEYPSRRGDPSPWEAKWSLARTRPCSPRRNPIVRGVLALLVALAIIFVADLVLSGAALGLVALTAVLVAFAFLRF